VTAPAPSPACAPGDCSQAAPVSRMWGRAAAEALKKIKAEQEKE